MATLETMQRYADGVADKLGLQDGSRPVLRWFGAPCKRMGRAYAHCHIVAEPGLPRGTVCLARGRTENDGGSWRRLITHEVTHLRVRNHNSQAFLKWMLKLGQGTLREKRVLIRTAALRHRHEWALSSLRGNEAERQCRLCAKTETGTITWKHS